MRKILVLIVLVGFSIAMLPIESAHGATFSGKRHHHRRHHRKHHHLVIRH